MQSTRFPLLQRDSREIREVVGRHRLPHRQLRHHHRSRVIHFRRCYLNWTDSAEISLIPIVIQEEK
jgi:hypothetical protein